MTGPYDAEVLTPYLVLLFLHAVDTGVLPKNGSTCLTVCAKPSAAAAELLRNKEFFLHYH